MEAPTTATFKNNLMYLYTFRRALEYYLIKRKHFKLTYFFPLSLFSKDFNLHACMEDVFLIFVLPISGDEAKEITALVC